MGFKARQARFAFTRISEAENPRETKSPLTRACYEGELARVRQLIAAGADIHGNDNQRWFGDASGCISGAPYYTPLGEASRAGKASVVKVLIDAGADIDALQYTSKSPLFEAVASGYPKVVEHLLDAGADVRPLGYNVLRNACGQTPTSSDADYAKTIAILGQRAGDALLGSSDQASLLAEFDGLPERLELRDKWERKKAAEQVRQLEALASVWRGDRTAIDQLLDRCERASGGREKAEDKLKTAARAQATQAATDPSWEAKIAKKIGNEINEGRVPDLQVLCREVLSSESAVAHQSWPRLVRQLMDLTIDFRAYTREIFGEAIDPNDDESGTMDGIGDEHMYSVDLVLEVLASDAALASPAWEDLFAYVCDTKWSRLGYYSFGEDELEALFAKLGKRTGIVKLRERAKKAWPFATL